MLSQADAISARRAGWRWWGSWDSHADSLCVNGKLAVRPGLINFSDSSLDRTAPSLDQTLHCHICGTTAVSCQLEGVLDPTRGRLQGLERVQFHNLLCPLLVLAASVIWGGPGSTRPCPPSSPPAVLWTLGWLWRSRAPQGAQPGRLITLTLT